MPLSCCNDKPRDQVMDGLLGKIIFATSCSYIITERTPRLEDGGMPLNDAVHRVNRFVSGEHRGSGIREDRKVLK